MIAHASESRAYFVTARPKRTAKRMVQMQAIVVRVKETINTILSMSSSLRFPIEVGNVMILPRHRPSNNAHTIAELSSMAFVFCKAS